MPSASAETTVRHTPLTARLSPAASSGAKVVVTRSRKPAGVGLTSATSPIDSIRPVNIGFDQHILAKHPQAPPGDPLGVDDGVRQPGHPLRPEHAPGPGKR